MKKLYRPLCFVAAVAAMSLTSCQKENFNPAGEGETVTITVHANVEDVANATKTHIEGTQVLWDENEEMKVIAFNNADPENTGSESVSTEFTHSADFTTATFKAAVSEGKKPDRIAGVYPADAAVGLGSVYGQAVNATSYKVELSAAQSATADSYDPASYIMIARADAYPLDNGEWTAYYKRATALNHMILSGITDDIKSVTITFPEGQQAAGRRYYNLATGEAGEIYSGQTNAVTVNYATPLKAGNGENDVWFTSWNVNVKQGEAITVKAESATKIYTKTLTATKDVALMENYLNIFQFDMTGAEVEAIDPAEDLSGDYLIVSKKENNDGSWVYMSEIYTNNKYFTRGETNIPASREFSSLTTADFQDIDNIEKYVWTISKSSNGYIISNSRINDEGTKYLEPDDSENQAHCSDNEVSVYIEAGENGTVKIQANSSINRWLQYNGNKGQERFACYESTQNEIYLLPWVESTEPTLIVSETSKTVSADATEIVFEYIARNLTGDVTATVASDEAQIISGTPVVDAAASTVTVTLNPNTDEVEKTATITLSADGVEPITLTVNQKAFVPESTTIKATVAEFLAAEVNDNVWYELTGTITDLYNTEYGNFHLVDETGTVRVYGLTAEKVSSNDKSFSSLGLKEGDIVTLIGTRTEYNNEAQVGGPAYYVSHVVAPYCNVSPNTIPVAADATSATFKVDANVEWKITSNNPTFTVSPASGTEAAEVTVSFPANESDEEVTVILTVSSELGDKTVTISQASASASTVVLLNEDFTGLSGDNTSNNGANSLWSGNDNFPTVTRAYQAGDAVKLGTGSKVGSIESKPMTVPAGTTLTVAFDVKGWTTVEGDIEVSFNGETQTVSYSAVMSGSFESKSVSFVVNSETSSTVKFATTAKRAYLDNIVISYTK